MGKEIERKWLASVNDVEFYQLLDTLGTNVVERIPILDHYINDTTRLRYIDGKPCITVKSIGTLNRDEYEFNLIVSPNIWKFHPFLSKTRFKILYKHQIFEVNVFDNIFEDGHKLILVELELQTEDQPVDLPDWVGKEVTTSPEYYGYNLFKRLLATK